MSKVYCSRADVYNVGVPRAALTRAARPIESVDPATNIVQQSAHGLNAGDAVQFTTTGPATLPAPLALATVYYALAVILGDGTADENRFQVSATRLGAAIDLTTAGTGTIALAIQAGPTIDSFVESMSRWIDQLIPAEAVPLADPIPAWVRNTVALRAAIASAHAFGRDVSQQLLDAEENAITDALRLAPGVPLRGDATAQTSTMLAQALSGGAGTLVKRGTIP